MNTQAENVADAAGSLADMAEALKQAMGQFRTSEAIRNNEQSFPDVDPAFEWIQPVAFNSN
jgi:hypothetical protein